MPWNRANFKATDLDGCVTTAPPRPRSMTHPDPAPTLTPSTPYDDEVEELRCLGGIPRRMLSVSNLVDDGVPGSNIGRRDGVANAHCAVYAMVGWLSRSVSYPDVSKQLFQLPELEPGAQDMHSQTNTKGAQI